jgi:signal transduction histidine kinase
MNAEATPMEVIRIHNWLQSLPDPIERNSLDNRITDFLKRLGSSTERLSNILPDILQLAREHQFPELAKFCAAQLKGLSIPELNATPDEFKYRIQDVIISTTFMTSGSCFLILSRKLKRP